MFVLVWSCLSPLLLRQSSHNHSHAKEMTFGFSSAWQNLEFWGLLTFEFDSYVPVSKAGEQNIAHSGVYKLELWTCQGSTLKTECNWSLQVVINLESRQGKKKIAFEWFAQNLTEKKMPYHCRRNEYSIKTAVTFCSIEINFTCWMLWNLFQWPMTTIYQHPTPIYIKQ